MTTGVRPGCAENRDPRGLIREGTDQVARTRAAPDPAAVLVDERGPENAMVFAAAYAGHLRFAGPAASPGTADPDASWQRFFASDVSAQLALIATEDVGGYGTTLTGLLRTLTDPPPSIRRRRLRTTLATVFDCLGTLALRFDGLSHDLPPDQPLREVLRTLIRTRLAPMLRRLIGYYRAGHDLGVIRTAGGPDARIRVLGRPLVRFGTLVENDDTLRAAAWAGAFRDTPQPPFGADQRAAFTEAYGPGTSTRERVNQLASHNLFRAIVETFLATLSRVVGEAKAALRASLDWPGHQPHYALFLAFLQLLEHARAATNTLTARHLDFYYRRVLRLERRPAAPSRAHVLVELAKHADSHLLPAGTLLQAGKDDLGHDAHATVDRELVANRAGVVQLRSLYRHPAFTPAGRYDGRIFAGEIATDEPWHPFIEKRFANGVLASIVTPESEAGFAVASHYLWLAEGTRTITLTVQTSTGTAGFEAGRVRCRLTTAKGWLDTDADLDVREDDPTHLVMTIEVGGDGPAITPYEEKVHECGFVTGMPVLLVTLPHPSPDADQRDLRYADLAGVRISGVTIEVQVVGLRTLALSNDNGPVDPSKPFLAFGATPVAGSSLVIGSKEVFQKSPTTVTLNLTYLTKPRAHPASSTPKLLIDQLGEGAWDPRLSTGPFGLTEPLVVIKRATHPLTNALKDAPSRRLSSSKPLVTASFSGVSTNSVNDAPDLTPDVPYTTASRSGYARLRLSGGFGTDTYPLDLATWIAGKSATAGGGTPEKAGPESGPSTSSGAGSGSVQIVRNLDLGMSISGFVGNPLHQAEIATPASARPQPPVLPLAGSLTLDYEARQTIDLGAPSEAGGRFFHVTPFGHAERSLTDEQTDLPLLPPFLAGNELAEGELYVGVAGLAPPQNLALLFQVVDGTANPLATKPDDHLRWSYLCGNEWVRFPAGTVGDGTDGLLASGIVALAVPPDADLDHTLLPAGLHWLRIAVAQGTDAVCRLITVAAQALTVTDLAAERRSASPGLPAGTVTKLDTPAAQVKGISQPFASFGGRPVEGDAAFAARVSERLRHKDRAIALWDYEHLILEAFPAIYQARCLNHTQYEPGDDGGVYRELAPGHVTVVTIPDLATPNPFDPLRPFTSLRMLGEIYRFLSRRMPAFTTLHVRNPIFEEVHIALRARFREGTDETFAIDLLRREITEFLSPWAFRGDARPSFNGAIHKSVLVDFIDDRGYVDYVTDVRLFRPLPGVAGLGPNLERVAGSRAVSILVSAPAGTHGIEVIRGIESAGGERSAPGRGWCDP